MFFYEKIYPAYVSKPSYIFNYSRWRTMTLSCSKNPSTLLREIISKIIVFLIELSSFL